MRKIMAVLLAVAIGLGLLISTATSAQAATNTETPAVVTAEQSLCFTSSNHAEWYGVGIYISHCDLQQLTVDGGIQRLVYTVVGIPYQFVPAVAAAVEVYLSYLKSIDRGNGVYVLQSTVGPNVTYIWAT